MNLYDKFLKTYFDGFYITNNYYSLEYIKDKLVTKKAYLKQSDNNFFFYEDTPRLLTYFINEPIKFDIENISLRIHYKNAKFNDKHLEFLNKNKFKNFETNESMNLKISTTNFSKLEIIDFCKDCEITAIYEFFMKYFSEPHLFNFTFDELKTKSKIREILCYKENGNVHGALIFSKTISSVFVDFIAVDRNLSYKNVAFMLMSSLFNINQNIKNFSLYVRDDNVKAINFYKRLGFMHNGRKIKYYKNF
ncbi:GNAT family N-acetyltransferase [Campylobacter sp. RM12327]|uniref:GNAT family N-acetyltransferase n=1 Tax=Campylobacter sputorum TaxID=206 RepID=UPI000B7885CD|nr:MULTISPECIES: GNAT family N-acetyltransferase [Campylobacter]ASM40733.1 acetyltransferase, RimI family [Campylobacter sputorum]MBE7357966.1 GNAT family N-acetyltransferase [Campylobacter sp. RM11302]MBF6669632.1 GNAT family N-acetyltransferase [Campylobacter sp. RM12327]MBF6674896.1 GNAT family N-acetyltransferase [Campylobacter sp. RM13538]MBF6676529.1 GNAT family N-acetyltransferase [Campylobacter sp. RM12321]